VRLWQLPEGKLLQTMEGHRNVELDGVLSLAFSLNGRVLASGGTDGRVLLWSSPSGRLKCTLKGHIGPITALVVTPDGKLLASGSGDGTIRLWSAELARLSHLPAGQASLRDLDWAQHAVRDDSFPGKAKAALAFIEALLRRRRRLDIFVDDALPRVIE